MNEVPARPPTPNVHSLVEVLHEVGCLGVPARRRLLALAMVCSRVEFFGRACQGVGVLVNRDYHLDALWVYPNGLVDLVFGREVTPVVGWQEGG